MQQFQNDGGFFVLFVFYCAQLANLNQYKMNPYVDKRHISE